MFGLSKIIAMNNKIGIRQEDKYAMERRVAIPSALVKSLTQKASLQFEVESSSKRIFTDKEYLEAGAQIIDNKFQAPVIFGVKEMPLNFFEPKKTYVFFSHVIKGQAYNMPMLRTMMEKKCNLIDYERIVDNKGRRLIFFGRFAGLAGMINTLWSLGERLKTKGMETPFLKIKQSHSYNSLQDAKQAVREAGNEMAKNGLPSSLHPLIIGITGYGNVSRGAQEILDLLPVDEISPKHLLDANVRKLLSPDRIYKVIFKEADMSVPLEEDKEFDLQEYYKHPERFRGVFERYLPYLSVLMNCIYWDDRYPRIVTKKFLKSMFSNADPRLTVIGDVTCDPNGSVECTFKGTTIEDPVFTYDPIADKYQMGFDGPGILDMAVDILPSELPRESSEAFGKALAPYIASIAKADYSAPFTELELPNPVKKAMILHQGKLTPDYQYLKQYVT
jgi:alpha-aminoadipic semialdehyde synthase